MGSEIDKLIKYAIENDPEIAKEIALRMHRAYIRDKKDAEAFLEEYIDIDLWEMESLVNSKKFDFPKEEMDIIGVEIDD